MRIAGLCAVAMLLLSPTVFAFDDSESLDRDAVIDTIQAALERRLDPVEAHDLRFVPAQNYKEQIL